MSPTGPTAVTVTPHSAKRQYNRVNTPLLLPQTQWSFIGYLLNQRALFNMRHLGLYENLLSTQPSKTTLVDIIDELLMTYLDY